MHEYPWLIRSALRAAAVAATLVAMMPSAAPAQDIRGLEVCTAEKRMDRRTACLQADVEFLQQALNKLAHDTQDRMAAAERDLTPVQAEIAALKATVEKLDKELAQMQAKVAPGRKK